MSEFSELVDWRVGGSRNVQASLVGNAFVLWHQKLISLVMKTEGRIVLLIDEQAP